MPQIWCVQYSKSWHTDKSPISRKAVICPPKNSIPGTARASQKTRKKEQLHRKRQIEMQRVATPWLNQMNQMNRMNQMN